MALNVDARATVTLTHGAAASGHSTWASGARGLSGVLLPVYVTDDEDLGQIGNDAPSGCSPVLLEQKEEGSPCILTLCCGQQPPSLISSLLVTSEARTIEVYSQKGEYCGTCRGERDDSIQPDSVDRGPFYRKRLILESPSVSCEVKLLSLGGRSSVSVSRVVLGLRPQEALPTDRSPCPGLGPSIDMQRVQSLMEEMGTSLSPGAQNLMDMVHFQQKNQANALSGFLPLLMGGGALSALARGANGPLATVRNGPQPAATMPQVNTAANGALPTATATTTEPTDPAPSAQNGAPQSESDSAAPAPGSSLPGYRTKNRPVAHSESPGPVSHAQLAEMMSHFLNGQMPGEGCGQALSSTPNFLPMLQSVCGQVTQLRLDDAAAAEKERTMTNGTWELDQAMECRLEQMERRLKEHIDHRLDALEQRLEKALLAALPSLSLNQGTREGGPASTGSSEQTQAAQVPALH
ncbi:ATPase PAAT [Polymixia lowei]